MADQFVSEIRIFAGTFAPLGWALCNGQLMAISQNTALFSLIGTFYGGDGKSTFGLPNLQGSIPMNAGNGVGLSQRFIGEVGGLASVTLSGLQIPVHSHVPQAAATGGLTTPAVNVWGEAKIGKGSLNVYAPFDISNGVNNVPMNTAAVLPNGGSLPHNNLPPYLCLAFIIALQGIFPSRN